MLVCNGLSAQGWTISVAVGWFAEFADAFDSELEEFLNFARFGGIKGLAV